MRLKPNERLIIEEIKRRNGEAMVWIRANHAPEVWDCGHTPTFVLSSEKDPIVTVTCIKVSVDIYRKDWIPEILHQVYAISQEIESIDTVRRMYKTRTQNDQHGNPAPRSKKSS